ncbi:MAG: ATP-binding protein [Blautia sp.]|nr:ATP-binding protein [Blautia sp.]
MSNPYTLTFGQPPTEIIHRGSQIERIISDFSSDSPSNYINLITGIRGSGKTVFLTETANRLKERDEWIVIDLNPQRDLLTSLAAKLNSNRQLNSIFRAAEINLEFFGIGVGIKTAPPVTDIEEALSRMLESVKTKGKRILVTIDEVTNSKEMRIFASAFQIFLRKRLPIFLLMTGLYKNINSLRNADGMTFLERAPRTVLNPLDFGLMVHRYMDTLNTGEDIANKLAAATRGYSFAFQTIGYFYYEKCPDLNMAFSEAKEYLFEFAYNKIWSELSGKDKDVLIAVAQEPTGKVADIRKLLNYTNDQFNPYRDRLVKAGILISSRPGIVEWALPYFDEFTIKMNRSLW